MVNAVVAWVDLVMLAAVDEPRDRQAGPGRHWASLVGWGGRRLSLLGLVDAGEGEAGVCQPVDHLAQLDRGQAFAVEVDAVPRA